MEARHRSFREAIKAGGLDRDVTHILPRNKDVSKHNEECLSALEETMNTSRIVYRAVDEALDVDLNDVVLRRTLDKALMAPRYLPLCAGARAAMCDGSLRAKGVYKGTKGAVVRFVK